MQRETSFIMSDFFLYKTCGSPNSATNMSDCYKLLQFAESLQMFESSKFIIAASKFYYGMFSQNAAQYLPPPTIKRKKYNTQKLYHKHLQDGIWTDAVSGWLL